MFGLALAKIVNSAVATHIVKDCLKMP